MRGWIPSVIAICTVLALTSSASGIETALLDDADSGGDAPSSTSDAEELESFGTYSATLTSDDTDAFALDTALAPSCVAVDVSSSEASAQILVEAVDASGSLRSVHGAFAPGAPARIPIAAPSVSRVSLLVSDPELGTLDAADYAFGISKLRAGEGAGDANSGADAGGGLGGAIPISRGCVAGSLLSGTTKDNRDVFSFSGGEGAVALLSFASTGNADQRLRLLDASGATLLSVHPGAVLSYKLPATGTYYLSTASTTSTDTAYVLGLDLGPPGSSPCRPNCYQG